MLTDPLEYMSRKMLMARGILEVGEKSCHALLISRNNERQSLRRSPYRHRQRQILIRNENVPVAARLTQFGWSEGWILRLY